jgi:uncharacterized protein (TIGR03067 family)
MRFKALALFVGSLLVSSAASARADDKREAADAKALNGTWQVVSQITEGKDEAIPKDGGDMVVISDGKYTVQKGDKAVCTGTFVLDSSRTPKSITNTIEDGDSKGKTALGIYEATGDEMKVSWSKPGDADRPLGFEAKSYRVTTLKRVKR